MIVRRALLSLALFGCCISASLLRAGDSQPSNVSPADQLQFQQKNAQAQMQELQERMYRLAELTREPEPDSSARLLMAVRKAREQLIIEQMKEALDLLATKDFSHAAQEQAQVLVKLEELKKLLTSTDLDLQLQLEKLRALNQAIAKLDAATREEKRQRDRSGELAKTAPADAKAAGALRNDQQQNRRATENIAQSIKDLGGSAAKAGTTLGGACQSMSLAEGHLAATKPSEAQPKQTEAVEAMRQARKQLVEERDKILQELERQVRRQVVENLTEMLERQKSVRAATETLVPRVTSAQQPPPRELLVRAAQLGQAENAIVRIAEQTVALIEQTQFSVALPPALRRVQQKCTAIAASLDAARADATTVDAEKQVERDLQDLIDTFKQLAAGKITPGSCKGCKGDKNKLLAELKVVRMMQTRVNADTRDADAARPGTSESSAGDVEPALRERIWRVRDAQAEVRDAVERIHQQLTAPDEPSAEEGAP